MASEYTKVLRVTPEIYDYVAQVAQKRGTNMNEAVDALLQTARSRLASVKRYADQRKPAPVGKPKGKPNKRTKEGKARAAKEPKAARDPKPTTP